MTPSADDTFDCFRPMRRLQYKIMEEDANTKPLDNHVHDVWM